MIDVLLQRKYLLNNRKTKQKIYENLSLNIEIKQILDVMQVTIFICDFFFIFILNCKCVEFIYLFI